MKYFTKNELLEMIQDRNIQIADLKAELTKYKSYKTTDERIKDLENLYYEYKQENTQLKQQLEHKEEVIKKLKKIDRSDIGEMFLENAKLIIEKRQFAIQQLERVKKFCEDWKCYTEDLNYVIVEEKNGIRYVPTLYEELDTIIKELEGK